MAKSHFLSHTTKQSSRYRVALRVQSSVMKRLGLYHCAFSEMEKAHCNKRCEKAKELKKGDLKFDRNFFGFAGWRYIQL